MGPARLVPPVRCAMTTFAQTSRIRFSASPSRPDIRFAARGGVMYKMDEPPQRDFRRSGWTMLLTVMAAFPTYFMMSIGTGADPVSASFCAWLGICVVQGVVRGVPAGTEDAPPPAPFVNKCAQSVPQRFRPLGQYDAS